MSHEMEALSGMLRGLMAGVLLVMFVGLWLWVFRAQRRESFEVTSRLPLEEDRPGPGSMGPAPTGDGSA
jgi:cbb3-type cytochrome oxidase subunit 3